jgi:pimeloyl-ACP methyl ester carboxylesterase
VEGEVGPLISHFLTGSGGARIALRTAGDPNGQPVVFVHGWARTGADWSAQLSDPELHRFHLIALDLRGHGESDIPESGYDDPAVWAGDLAAVLDRAGAPAVLVGSSYGGLVITDYLRERSETGVAGVVLAGALTEIGPGNPGGAVGPLMAAGMRDYLSADPGVAVPALTAFTFGLTAEPAGGAVVQQRLGEFLRVPPRVRRALFRRSLGSADVLAGLTVPVLIIHGTADTVIDPSAAEYAAGKIPNASLRWFVDVGHLPFAERVDEFDTALGEFADRCGRTPS